EISVHKCFFRLSSYCPFFPPKISLTFSRTASLRAGFKYRIVLSMSECPSQCCTVRRSTPAQRQRVANVARNLCSQKLSFLSLARSATTFRSSRKFSLGLKPAVGKTRLQVLSAFAFHSFRLLTRFAGIGISRS